MWHVSVSVYSVTREVPPTTAAERIRAAHGTKGLPSGVRSHSSQWRWWHEEERNSQTKHIRL